MLFAEACVLTVAKLNTALTSLRKDKNVSTYVRLCILCNH